MIRLRALLTILIIGGGIYVGSKVAAAYYTYYQFQSDLEQLAMVNSYTTKPEADIQELVMARGRDYGIPLRLEEIRVKRAGTECSIWTSYTVHVDVPIHPFDMNFTPASKSARHSLGAGTD